MNGQNSILGIQNWHLRWQKGFKNDNPLANSSSYSVYVDKIEHQDALVKYIEGLDGVREVNQLKGATQTFVFL